MNIAEQQEFILTVLKKLNGMAPHNATQEDANEIVAAMAFSEDWHDELYWIAAVQKGIRAVYVEKYWPLEAIDGR